MALFFNPQTLKKEGNLFKIQHYGTTVSAMLYCLAGRGHEIVNQTIFPFLLQYKLRVHTQEQFDYMKYMPEIKEVR